MTKKKGGKPKMPQTTPSAAVPSTDQSDQSTPTTPDYRATARTYGPQLATVKRTQGLPCPESQALWENVQDGIMGMIARYYRAPADQRLPAAPLFAALVELTRLLGETKNDHILRSIVQIGAYMEEDLMRVWRTMEDRGEAGAVKMQYVKEVKELQDIYSRGICVNDPMMRPFYFLWYRIAGA